MAVEITTHVNKLEVHTTKKDMIRKINCISEKKDW
jgi:hypothetical protein